MNDKKYGMKWVMLVIIMTGITNLYGESNVSNHLSELTIKEKEAKKAKWRKMIEEMTPDQTEKFKADMHKKEQEQHKQWVKEYKNNTEAQESQKQLGSNNKPKIRRMDHEKNRKMAKDIHTQKESV